MGALNGVIQKILHKAPKEVAQEAATAGMLGSLAESFQKISEVNPKFPLLVYIMGGAAVLVVIAELYVTLLEYWHGDTPEYQDAVAARRARRRTSLGEKAREMVESVVGTVKDAVIRSPSNSPSRRKKAPRVDLGQFLTDLHNHGITVKRVKGPDGASPTPSKIKNLRIRTDGELYFHTETFKMKHFVVSPETWSIKDLVSCIEGDATMGEIYLEFQHPKKAARILRIIVPDEVERIYIIKAFCDVIEAYETHRVWIFDTLKHAEYLEQQHKANVERSPGPDSVPPSGTGASVMGGGHVTPQKMERTPPPGLEHPHGMSPLLRSPIKTPNRVGRMPDQVGSTSSTAAAAANITSPGGTTYKEPVHDLNTDFHTFTNKELKQAVVAEGLEKEAKGHRERLDLISILEKHYSKLARVMNNQPVVKTKENFESQLREIYTHYNPSKIDKIPGILEHFKGKEEHLLEQLYLKYDIKSHHHHLLGADTGA